MTWRQYEFNLSAIFEVKLDDADIQGILFDLGQLLAAYGAKEPQIEGREIHFATAPRTTPE